MESTGVPAGPLWPGDEAVGAAFERFPQPLALMGVAGRRAGNARFRSAFAPEVLDRVEIAEIALAPPQQGRRLRVPTRGGADAEVRVDAVRIPDGTLIVFDETPGGASSGELEELRRRISELERLSATDPLTGAWNRAHLDRVIDVEISRSQRFRQPVSLVLLDIDHFKDVNDTHGHAAGDAVLRELVAVIRATVRAADLVFRWGGEEFVVLAAATGYRAAGVLAAKLRAVVARHAFPPVGRITLSAGVAEHRATESAAAWFARLDAQLYAAKRGGRDRVCVDLGGQFRRLADGGRRFGAPAGVAGGVRMRRTDDRPPAPRAFRARQCADRGGIGAHWRGRIRPRIRSADRACRAAFSRRRIAAGEARLRSS